MTDKKAIMILDGDCIAFTAAAAGEKRHIEVYNEAGQLIGDWRTRTEFKAECKASGLEYSDYTVVDIQVPEPLANVLHTVKSMFQNALKLSGCSEYKVFLGSGDSFRLERSTLLRYKGNRLGTLRPLLLGEVVKYMVERFNAEVIVEIEADDAAVIACHGTDNVLVKIDKDFYGTGVRCVNLNRPDEGIINCNTFGKLWRDDKGKIRGYGRLFFYFQLAFGDVSDNYRSNCMSDKPFGEVAAYNALKDCKTDKEALTALVGIYQHLYPTPKTVTGWRGDLIEITWLYVLEEVWALARMLRNMSELTNPILCKDVLDKLGVPYES